MRVTVSIIVTTYNHEKYIRQAMDSIFIQKTDHSYEVLVGDDASTDGTQSVLKEYSAEYPGIVKLFLREKNIGGTRNSYELHMEAKGKYIAILEGDDYWTASDKLQKQVDFLESNPKFIGVCHKFATVDSNGNIIKKNVSFVKHKKIFRLLDFKAVQLPSQASSYVFRNIFADKNCDYSFLYKTSRNVSDQTAMLLFLSHGDFYCFDDVMSVYRIATASDASSITKTLYKEKKLFAVETDLDFTEKLELVIKDKFENSVDLTLRRKELYTSAVIRALKTRSFRGLSVLKKIRAGRSRLAFLAYVPVGIIKRVFIKIGW